MKYPEDKIRTKGHVKGYVTDGQDYPADSVQDCLNMDFYQGRDQRRLPYKELLDLSTGTYALPSGYVIDNFTEKQFIDKDGNTKNCLIVVCTKASNPTKIFMKSYYAPDTTSKSWQNAYKTSSFGWNDEWIELTERYLGGGGTYTFEAESHYVANTANSAGLIKITTTDNHNLITNDYVWNQGIGGTTEANGGWQVTVIDATNFTLNGSTFTNAFTGGGVSDKAWNISGTYYNMRSSNAADTSAKQADNYFKGFFCFTAYSELCGIVLHSKYSSSKLHCFIEKSDWDLLGSTGGLCRFPVNQYNRDNWSSISNVRFNTDNPGIVQMMCGKNSRDLWLGFITDRRYFGSYTIPATSDQAWCDPEGVYTGDREIIYYVKVEKYAVGVMFMYIFYWKNNYDQTTYTQFYTITTAGSIGARFTLNRGVIVYLNGAGGAFTHNQVAQFTVAKSATEKGWDGFWFGFDAPKVDNKSVYFRHNSAGAGTEYCNEEDIGEELGVRFAFEKVETSPSAPIDRLFYAVAVELDGYQSMFVKATFSGVAPTHEYPQKIYMYFEQWFDRRITASLLFFSKDADFDETNFKLNSLPEMFLLNDTYAGRQTVSKMGTTLENNADKVTLIARVDTLDPDKLSTAATGLSVNAYLGHYAWEDIWVKSKYKIRLGDLMICGNLSQDSVNRDDEQTPSSLTRNGGQFVCVSTLQTANGQQTLGSVSFNPTSRMTQVTSGEQIRGLAPGTGNRFLVMTDKNTYMYQIADVTTGKVERVEEVLYPGVTSDKSVVSAKTGTINFGSYWLNKDSGWGFDDNKVMDLMENRWQEKYQKDITDSNKNASMGGYLERGKEIWWVVGSTIYIWSLKYEHWKIYVFGDVPLNFAGSIDGELYFNITNKIYTTVSKYTAKSTSLYRDKNSVGIPFYWTEVRDNGRRSSKKIPHMVDLDYEMLTSQSLGVYNNATLKITAGGDTSLNDIYDGEFIAFGDSYVSKRRETQAFRKRIPSNFYTVKVSSKSADEDKIIDFTLNEQCTTALFIPRPLGKN